MNARTVECGLVATVGCCVSAFLRNRCNLRKIMINLQGYCTKKGKSERGHTIEDRSSFTGEKRPGGESGV